MKTQLNRRSFLQTAALAAGALSTAPFNILHAANAGLKLNCVVIGCGGRGLNNHVGPALTQNLVAIVDPDENRQAMVRKKVASGKKGSAQLQVFTDYRKMFDKIARQIDVVFVATPNHHHALAAMLAMQHGKNVYCEKPVCHDIGEARQLRAMAAKTKVATQMGNQGHCMEPYRRLCEYIWGGTIGNVTATYSWTDRANGGEGPRPPTKPVPAGLHWDEWIGPAPYRDFHDDLHPHEWHGWYDFGNGSIGNMGCHVLDGVFWALKVEHPTSVEVEQMRGGSDERYPLGSRIRWDIPARGDMPPVKSYWYEGLNPTTTDKASGGLHAAKGKARYLPPLFVEMCAKYPDEELDSRDSGTLYEGDKGIIYTGTYGDRMHILPMEKMKATPRPPQVLPRTKDIFTDFLEACLAGKTETAASFDYGTRLTEFTLLGNLAQRAGAGKQLEWDGPNMKVTNHAAMNAFVQRENRAGWKS